MDFDGGWAASFHILLVVFFFQRHTNIFVPFDSLENTRHSIFHKNNTDMKKCSHLGYAERTNTGTQCLETLPGTIQNGANSIKSEFYSNLCPNSVQYKLVRWNVNYFKSGKLNVNPKSNQERNRCVHWIYWETIHSNKSTCRDMSGTLASFARIHQLPIFPIECKLRNFQKLKFNQVPNRIME